MIGRFYIAWHSWRAARRLRYKAHQCAAIRAGAVRHGLDLAGLSDQDIETACRDTRHAPDLDGMEAEGMTRALARAVRRLTR